MQRGAYCEAKRIGRQGRPEGGQQGSRVRRELPRPQATPLQLISLALSILSIISKLYPLSLALNLRVFGLKLLMLAYTQGVLWRAITHCFACIRCTWYLLRTSWPGAGANQ